MKTAYIPIPELAFVVVIDKEDHPTFARAHFLATEVLEVDKEILAGIVEERLRLGKFTVISVAFEQLPEIKSLITLARKYNVDRVAIVVDFPPHHDPVMLLQKKYGIPTVHVLNPLQHPLIQKQKLPFDKKEEAGPFDIIGDIHGCFDELQALLLKLHYKIDFTAGRYRITHPDQRKLVFVGDLVDRGPKIVDVLQLVMDACEQNSAYCVIGNHEERLHRKLNNQDVALSHGLAETLEQLETQSPQFLERVKIFLAQLPSHYLFDKGKLAIAHAGIKQKYLERTSKRIRSFCMYGDTTGEMDEQGLPTRLNWAKNYRGKTKIVYGHTPIEQLEWLNNTLNIDTGCVFGGKLTALRYPEDTIIQENAQHVYYVR